MSDKRQKFLSEFAQVAALPTLPALLVRLEKILSDKMTGAEEIGKVILSDPGLTAQVLRVANSSFYGSRYGQVATIPQAVARLGLNEIRYICYAQGLQRELANLGSVLNHPDYWRHCIAVALAAQLLVRQHHAGEKIEREEVYVAGLLHDIGVLLYTQYRPDLIKSWCAGNWTEAPLEQELEFFNLSHAEAGGFLLEEWRIPEPIVHTVTWHHQPWHAPEQYQPMASLIHVADMLSRYPDPNLWQPSQSLPAELSSLALLDLSAEKIPDLLVQLQAEWKKLEGYIIV